MSNNTTATETTDMTTETTTTEEKAKRTRQSPREKAFFEAIDLLEVAMFDLNTEKETANKTRTATIGAIVEALSDVQGRIKGLAEAGPTVVGYIGKHYIGCLANGERVAFDSNALPTKRSVGEGTPSNFLSVLGPIHTKSGVEYRLTHKDAETPVVF